jgi:hypothetical protein
VPALLYGLFACYAVTSKCDLRMDSQGKDVTVFASLEDCERFASAAARQPPDKDGKWPVDEGHYYKCFGLTPMSVAGLPSAPETSRPVYKTTAEALQHDYQVNPEELTKKIGDAAIEISGTVEIPSIADGAALQLAGDTWDVTAWLTKEGMSAIIGMRKNQHVTLRCEKIGNLVSASGRRGAIVEVRDCRLLSSGK